MAPAFLEEMLELRMEIEELRAGPPDSAGRREMEKQLRRRTDVLIGDLREWFAELDAASPEDAKRRPMLIQVRQVLNAAKYVQGLLRDLRAD